MKYDNQSVIYWLGFLILGLACTDEQASTHTESNMDSMSQNAMDIMNGGNEEPGEESTMSEESDRASTMNEDLGITENREEDMSSHSSHKLVINEIQHNSPSGQADWIELFVTGNESVHLNRYSLIDENEDHTPLMLPDVVLQAGDYFYVEKGEQPDGFDFGLGANDRVTLLYDGMLVDELIWSNEQTIDGYTYGRYPDGEGEGQVLTPTPNASNQLPDTITPQVLFPTDEVIEVSLELSDEDWQAMQDDPLSEINYQGNIQYGTTRLEQVAIRVKGNSSLYFVSQTSSIRFSFKVDMNEYVSGQRLLGIKKLSFNNGFKDPTLLRESLSYDVHRAMQRAVPRTAFVNLTVAGEHLGLYTVVEQVDDLFLAQHFDHDEGALYKPELPSGSLKYLGDSIENYQNVGIKSDEETTDHSAWIRFIKSINEREDIALEDVLNIDDYLLNLALHVVLVNLDSYLGMGHNFYLYEQEGVFTEITWDLNESFGNFTCGCDREGLIAFYIDEPSCGSMDDYPLLERIFENPDYVARYHQMLEMVIDGPAHPDNLALLIQQKADLIRPYVAEDPSKFFSLEDFEQNLTQDVDLTIMNRFANQAWGLTSFMEDRIAHIRLQLAGEQSRSANGVGNCNRSNGMQGNGMQGNNGNCPPCGDGVCDNFEMNNPEICPRDCVSETRDWCGDGICDALEACMQTCAEDCL